MPNSPPVRAGTPSVLVIGAGIIGACVAYRLARGGAAVTVLDAIGPHAGASGRSWAWINAVAADTPSYVELRRAGIAAYHSLQRDLPGRLEIDWIGSILWDSDLFDPAADYSGRDGIRRVDPQEMRTLEPFLETPPTAALYSPEDGLVDGAHAAATVLSAASGAGARLCYGQGVDRLVIDAGTTIGVAAGEATLRADCTVVCAGTGTAPLLATAGLDLPTGNRAGLLVTTAPVDARLSRAIWTDTVHVKQLRDGRLLIGENAHAPGALTDPENLAESMMRRTESLLPAIGPLRIEKTTVATRPIPGDGYPVIGPVDGLAGLYIATMHSGITLGAVTGELAAAEILSGEPEKLLAAFRPGRFAGMIAKDSK